MSFPGVSRRVRSPSSEAIVAAAIRDIPRMACLLGPGAELIDDSFNLIHADRVGRPFFVGVVTIITRELVVHYSNKINK